MIFEYLGSWIMKSFVHLERENHSGMIANGLDYGIVGSEFELQSR